MIHLPQSTVLSPSIDGQGKEGLKIVHNTRQASFCCYEPIIYMIGVTIKIVNECRYNVGSNKTVVI